MTRRRSFAFLAGHCAVLVIIGCSPEAREVTDSVAGATGDPRTLSLGEVAGTWNVRATPERGGDSARTFVLDAKADTSGWTIRPSSGEAMPVRVWAQGDSVVAEATYETPQRPGASVAAHWVFRLQGDSLVGVSTVRQGGSRADSVVRHRMIGTRAR